MVRLACLFALCLVHALAASHIPVYATSQEMRCGMILRDPEQIQIWCWSGVVFAPETALCNTVISIRGREHAGIKTNYMGGSRGSLSWKFTIAAGVVSYEVTGGTEPVTGRLE